MTATAAPAVTPAPPKPRARRRSRRPTMIGLAFLSPWLLGFLAFTLYPVLATLYYSFTDYSLFGTPQWVGLDNYRELTHDSTFVQAFTNTLVFTALVVPLSIVLAISLALLLHRPARGLAAYRTIIFAPSIVPAAATAAIWMWLLNPQFGLVNGALRLFGAPTPPWLSDPDWAKVSVLLMSLWMIGSDMLLYLAALQDIPVDYYEAAAIDGASAWQRLRSITLPHLTPVMLFQLINALIWSFQYFSIPYIVGQQGQGKPAGSLNFYAVYLYKNAFSYLKMGYASAMAWIMFIVVMALTIIAIRTSNRWVHYAK
ncbi:carbohydrate ABC transporter permease [Dactylosporangium siamense]|uniref:Spermidine/putrescine ABC transporter permease n=1 Tax=Dactylosporangium siamense TaxID=685454 RepID=A0A919PX60_9ACTN|nr:sugar ABC transporter permease [Dactylosporangium siamense]GIG50133.1 spermidine/putrescine ABC transporter permease [Dactylosporangium siamense]